MANFSGGSTKNVDMVMVVYDNQVKEGKNGNTYAFVDAQVLQGVEGANKDLPAQSNPHLVSEKRFNEDKTPMKGKNGKDVYNNNASYTGKQLDSIADKAVVQDMVTKDGQNVGKAYFVNADVMLKSGKDKNGRPERSVINTKSVSAPSVKIPDNAFAAHLQACQDNAQKAREANKAKEADKQAEAPQAEAQAAEVEQQEADQEATPFD